MKRLIQTTKPESEQEMIAMKRECLSGSEIRRVLQGEMPRAEFDSAISHLDQCESCRSNAETLREDELGLSDRFASPPLDELQNESACQVALCKIIQDPLEKFEVAEKSDRLAIPCETLGPYRLLGALGAGGMGTVYLAEHERLKRKCAIKLLPRERVSQPGWLDRFDREMTTIASLEHAHVVRATDAGHQSGWHYLVMEHLDGMDVSRIASRMGQLSVADACEIGRQAALGLAHIHDAGLVHRDIKPSNLMLTRRGTVKLLDLGLVLPGDDPLAVDDRLTTVGHVMGTMPYMAPEQLSDSRLVSPLADIYALGATLYRLISGRPPHGRKRGLAAQVLAITSTDAPRLDSTDEETDRDVAELVAQMLDRDPAKRPQSALEVADRLANHESTSRLKPLVREAARRPGSDDVVHPSLMPSRATTPSRGQRGPWHHWLFGSIATLLLLTAATVIKIQTDKGDLVIHSDVEGLTIVIKQDNQVVDRLTIESKEEQRKVLHKGTYQIEIEGGGPALRLSDEVVTIGRSDEKEVSISAVRPETPAGAAIAANDPGDKPKKPGVDAASELAKATSFADFQFAPLRKAEETIQNATDLDDVGDAMVEAVVFIESGLKNGLFINDPEKRRIADAILYRARELGGLESKIPPPRDSHAYEVSDTEHFMWYFQEAFHRIPVSITLSAAAKELRDGNGRSRAAVLPFLQTARPENGRFFEPFTVSNLIRGCSALVLVEGNESVWEGLPDEYRNRAANLALENTLRFCEMHDVDPMSIPLVEQVLNAKPTDQLTDDERVAMKLPPQIAMENFVVIDPNDAGKINLNEVSLKTTEMIPDVTQDAGDLVYQGKRLDEWLQLLAVEQDPIFLGRIIVAIETLTKDSNARAGAAGETLRVARRLGGAFSSRPSLDSAGISTANDRSAYFMHFLRETFPHYLTDPGLSIIARELDEGVGNEKSQMASVLLLNEYLFSNRTNATNADEWFGANERRKKQGHQMVMDLLRIFSEFSNDSTGLDEMSNNHTAESARQCALRIQLHLGGQISEHSVLKNLILTEVDKAMRRWNKTQSADNYPVDQSGTAGHPLTEDVLVGAVQLIDEESDGNASLIATKEHWKLYLNRLFSISFMIQNTDTLKVFDRLEKTDSKSVAETIEMRLETIKFNPSSYPSGMHCFASGWYGNSLWKKALPFIAKQTDNPENVLSAIEQACKEPYVHENTKLIDEVAEAIGTLQERLE